MENPVQPFAFATHSLILSTRSLIFFIRSFIFSFHSLHLFDHGFPSFVDIVLHSLIFSLRSLIFSVVRSYFRRSTIFSVVRPYFPFIRSYFSVIRSTSLIFSFSRSNVERGMSHHSLLLFPPRGECNF